MLIKRAEQTSCRLTCFWVENIKNEELVVCKNSKISRNSQDISNMIVSKNFKGFFLACVRSTSHMVSISGRYRPFSIFKDNHVHKLWEFGFFLQFLKIEFFAKLGIRFFQKMLSKPNFRSLNLSMCPKSLQIFKSKNEEKVPCWSVRTWKMTKNRLFDGTARHWP